MNGNFSQNQFDGLISKNKGLLFNRVIKSLNSKGSDNLFLSQTNFSISIPENQETPRFQKFRTSRNSPKTSKFLAVDDITAKKSQIISKNNSLVFQLNHKNNTRNLFVSMQLNDKSNQETKKKSTLNINNLRKSIMNIEKNVHSSIFSKDGIPNKDIPKKVILRKSRYSLNLNFKPENRLFSHFDIDKDQKRHSRIEKKNKTTKLNERDSISTAQFSSEKILNEAKRISEVKVFKNKNDFNNFLIRNHKISEHFDPVLSSKMKLKMTENLYLRSQSSFKNTNISRNSETSLQISFHEEENKNLINEHKESNPNIADLIAEITEPEYEEIEFDSLKLINNMNLERLVKIKEIYKNKFQFIANLDDKPKRQDETDEKISLRVRKMLGPPKYLKTKFKKETMEKYKSVNGQNFLN